MKPINTTLTGETAQAVLWALREYLNTRTPVREYVDKRYAHMDNAFRNCKIGEVQERLNRVQAFIDRTQTQLNMEAYYEKAQAK
jgi:hypothetical protein